MEKQPSPEGNTYLSKLRNVAFFIAVYSYFAGFVYQYYLYRHLGISLGSLDIPFYYFFVYSYTVIMENLKPLAAIAVGLPILYGIFTWMASRQTNASGTPSVNPEHEGVPESGRGKGNLGRGGEPPRSEFKLTARVKGPITNAWKGLLSQYVTLVLLLTIPIVFAMAKRTGDDLAVEMRMGQHVKPIKFFFRDGGATRYPEEFVRANEKETLKLLIETSHSFYVLDQSIGEEKELPSGFSYVVSKDDIALARVWLVNVPKPRGAK